MIKKIKYIFLDFSEGFKNDFLNTFKKSVIFLVAGIILYALQNLNDTIGSIGAICIVIFGIFWCKNLFSALKNAIHIPNNIALQWVLYAIIAVICFIIGYIYFAWSVVKIIVYYMKRAKQSK